MRSTKQSPRKLFHLQWGNDSLWPVLSHYVCSCFWTRKHVTNCWRYISRLQCTLYGWSVNRCSRSQSLLLPRNGKVSDTPIPPSTPKKADGMFSDVFLARNSCIRSIRHMKHSHLRHQTLVYKTIDSKCFK